VKCKYTTAIHAKRLKQMLKRKDPCACCPAAPYFDENKPSRIMWSDKPNPCRICLDFVGLTHETGSRCPCFILDERAIIETLKALERWEKSNERS